MKPVLAVLQHRRLTAIAHVTGGGLQRRLPSLVGKQPGLRASWTQESWPVPAIFRRIQQIGGVSSDEMYRTFNMGIGMALTCRDAQRAAVLKAFKHHGLNAWIIGRSERSRS